jgi:hypothetical protein
MSHSLLSSHLMRHPKRYPPLDGHTNIWAAALASAREKNSILMKMVMEKTERG